MDQNCPVHIACKNNNDYENTFVSNYSFPFLGVDVTRFKTALGMAIHDLESMGNLHMEATILSRLIYRMKSKFRNDKGLRYMVKLNKALLNYYNMSLKKEYTDLRSDLRMEDGTYILPSRQRLEYMLARTQGFGKLMTRIEEISRYTSHFLRARIKLGHAWSIALVAFGTTSRIWYCLYKQFIINSLSSYSNNNIHFFAGFMQGI